MEHITEWWGGLNSWATSGIRIVSITIGAMIVASVLSRVIRTFRDRVTARMEDRETQQRAETLGRVVRYIASVVVWLIAGIAILAELGISVAPILGAAGVVGVAVGFGAQSLVKDYFTGFFLLLENQIRQGDVVKLDDHSGLVEEVTLRYVRLRDYDGNVHFVPNGEVKTVISMSRHFSFAVVDIAVAYREDIDRVMQVIRDTAEQLRADDKFAARILEPFELAGVEQWADSSVVIRGRFKTSPLEQWTIKREYLKRLKRAFDEHGIEIPFPQMTIHAGQPNPDEPAAIPLALSRLKPSRRPTANDERARDQEREIA